LYSDTSRSAVLYHKQTKYTVPHNTLMPLQTLRVTVRTNSHQAQLITTV